MTDLNLAAVRCHLFVALLHSCQYVFFSEQLLSQWPAGPKGKGDLCFAGIIVLEMPEMTSGVII